MSRGALSWQRFLLASIEPPVNALLLAIEEYVERQMVVVFEAQAEVWRAEVGECGRQEEIRVHCQGCQSGRRGRTCLWALGESLVPWKVLKALWAPFRR